MEVREVMNTDVRKVRPDAPLARVARKLVDSPHSLVHVVDGEDKLLGIISTIDVLRLLMPFYMESNLARSLPRGLHHVEEAYQHKKDLTAAELMHSDITSITPRDHILHAEALIRERTINALPVVDEDGVLVGEISRREVLGLLAAEFFPHDGEEA